MEVNNLKSFQLKPVENKGLISEVAGMLKFKYWVSAGTALGLYRDDDLVEGDTDIDFALIGYDGVDNDIRALGFDEIRNVYHEEKPQQLAFIYNDTIIDFYIHWEEGDDYVNYGERGKQRMPKYMYDTRQIMTKYGLLPFPKYPEEYFERRYGDWKIKQDKKAIYETI